MIDDSMISLLDFAGKTCWGGFVHIVMSLRNSPGFNLK